MDVKELGIVPPPTPGSKNEIPLLHEVKHTSKLHRISEGVEANDTIEKGCGKTKDRSNAWLS